MTVRKTARLGVANLAFDSRNSTRCSTRAAGNGGTRRADRRLRRRHLTIECSQCALSRHQVGIELVHFRTRRLHPLADRTACAGKDAHIFGFKFDPLGFGLAQLLFAGQQLLIEETQRLGRFNAPTGQIALHEQVEKLLDDIAGYFSILGIGTPARTRRCGDFEQIVLLRDNLDVLAQAVHPVCHLARGRDVATQIGAAHDLFQVFGGQERALDRFNRVFALDRRDPGLFA